MKKFFDELKKYPIVIIFFCFLFLYSFADSLVNNKLRDEYENRSLAQFPAFSWKDLVSNKWTVDYEEYIQDQFIFRHQWIVAKSFSESLLMKTENNNVVYGADGYQFYKFMALKLTTQGDTQLSQNIGYLMRFAQRHPGLVSVMIAPSASNILSDKLPAGIPLLDENPYLDEMFDTLSSSAAVYDLRDILRANAEDYLYYRTDHHWTTAGAYLAYCQFVQDKQLPVFDTTAANAVEVSGFTGTNYNKSLKYNTVSDTLTYYDIPNVLTIKEISQANGEELSSESGRLYDLDKLDTRDKYAAFLRGNNGYCTIEGNGTGRILVIKDSYANCFIPFLTADYAQIDVVDLRYWKYNVDALIDEYHYDDVLVLYNFQTFSSEATLFYLNAMVNA